MFGVGVVIAVLYWIFSAISGAVMIAVYGTQGLIAAMQQGLPFAFLIGSAVLSTLLTAVVATIQTSLYIELRDWKDGPATEALTEIFA